MTSLSRCVYMYIAADVVRDLRQPPGSVYILFPLRAQHNCALGVEERLVKDPVVHDQHFEHRRTRFH